MIGKYLWILCGSGLKKELEDEGWASGRRVTIVQQEMTKGRALVTEMTSLEMEWKGFGDWM